MSACTHLKPQLSHTHTHPDGWVKCFSPKQRWLQYTENQPNHISFSTSCHLLPLFLYSPPCYTPLPPGYRVIIYIIHLTQCSSWVFHLFFNTFLYFKCVHLFHLAFQLPHLPFSPTLLYFPALFHFSFPILMSHSPLFLSLLQLLGEENAS